MSPIEIGRTGEAYVAYTLRSIGLSVCVGGPADLRVNGTPVEVKSANPAPYRRGYWGYQFCLNRTNHTSVKAPIVVLLCYHAPDSDPAAFIIPSQEVGKRHKITIPQRHPWQYAGRWSPWYERWEALAEFIPEEV